MALDSTNVRVAVTGAVYVGSDTATAPVDAETPLTGYVDLGYVSEDGVTETRDRSTDPLKAWQNSATVRTLVTDGTLSYQFTLLETKKEVLEAYYGATVAADGSIVVNPTATSGRKPYVLDVIDGDDFIRAYIPSGEITEFGDQVYAAGEPIGYEVTVTAYAGTYGETGSEWTGSAKKFYSSLAAAA